MLTDKKWLFVDSMNKKQLTITASNHDDYVHTIDYTETTLEELKNMK